MEWTDLTRSQHGLVTKVQLLEHSVTENQLEWLTRSGKLEVKYPGVYVLPGIPETWSQRALAALFSAGECAALSHRSAAQAHDLQGVEYERQISVLVPYARLVRTKGYQAHRTRARLPTTIVNGMTVTSLGRTFVDLAAVVTDRELELALDHAVRRRKTVDWLFHYLDDLKQPKRKGLRLLRELAEMRRDGAMDSELEVEVWRVLRQHGFPPFVKRFIVKDGDRYVIRLDFAWPEKKVVLHADSLRHHQSPKQMARDAWQRAKLDELGWRQMSVVKPMLIKNEWLSQLRRLLGTA
jgi:very-short-patch-repair endonuclease